LLLSVAFCAAAPAQNAEALPPGPFPEYEAIRGNVTFWKRVWAEWTLGQVAVHDLEYPGVVYEVVELPGEVEERYTDEQLDFVEETRERWEKRLGALEVKVDSGADLETDEKRLVLLLTTNAGTDALRDAGERVRTQRGLRERFRRGLEISRRYDATFRQIFLDRGLPEDLAYLPHVESSFQWAARSSAGAVGIWQFTRGTGQRYMYVTSSLDERLDPVAAARGAAVYMKDAYARLGDWPLALTAYNHGIQGIARAIEEHGRDYQRIYLEYEGRLFGFASRNFYAEFLAAREIACDPERYFPEGLQYEPEFDHDTVIIEHRTTPGRIAAAYDVPLDELAAINPGWSKRAVQGGLALPEDIQIWLPAGTLARLAEEGEIPVPAAVDGDGIYIVQRGDTLSSVAGAFGMRVSDLRALNDMSNRESLIRVGQKLTVTGDVGGLAGALTTAYVVRRGDTLSEIARAHRMRVRDLLALNDLPRGSSMIHVGQKLVVAEVEPNEFHVVRRGDTLTRIAAVYGVRLADLLRANALNLQSMIYPGQTIRIPTP
jgi:membrane-bound lytic murein transglycosylase D